MAGTIKSFSLLLFVAVPRAAVLGLLPLGLDTIVTTDSAQAPMGALHFFRLPANRRPWLVLSLICATVLLGLSALLSYGVVYGQYRSLAKETATDALEQMMSSREHLAIIFNALSEAAFKDPCSKEAVDTMARLRYAITGIVAVGYIEGNRLMCTSLGAYPKGIPIGLPEGTPDIVGMTTRTGVRIDVLGSVPFTVLSIGHHAVIMPSELGPTLSERARSAGVVFWVESKGSRGAPGAYYASGVLPPALALARSSESSPDGWSIYRKTSLLGHTFVVAVPQYSIIRTWLSDFLRLAPVLALAGPVLAWAMMLFARLVLACSWRLVVHPEGADFEIAYRPIVELASGRWVGLRASVGRRNKSGEVEHYDLQNGTQALTATQTMMSESWHLFSRLPELRVFAGFLSRGLLLDTSLGERLKRQLERYGVLASRVICGMTERSFADEARAEDLLSKLRSTGAAVSVDDFGLGFADLSYVAKLDLDYVRLGSTVVRSIGASEEKAAMVGQFITFARSIGAQVIANGVENSDQERYLRSCGVALAEGPYYGAELGIEDAARELSGQSIARQTRARLGA